jgi:ubiquinone/menaquinone biosynthesis C-methylase UbiE
MLDVSNSKDKRLQGVNEEEILAANIRFHRVEAEVYDTRHGEILNQFTQRRIKKLVRRTLDILRNLPEINGRKEIIALDCGTGTGNISGKMLSEGCMVDAVDISPEMLAVMGVKFKSRYEGRYRLINCDIDSFLSSKELKRYDLITFSSTLHHLHDYTGAFLKAVKVLRRPGIIMVLHEPLPKDRVSITNLSNVLRKIDRFLWKYEGKILRKKGPTKSVSDEDAFLADFHSRMDGVNPEIFFQIINQNSGKILHYKETSENMRYWWSALIDNFLKMRKDTYQLVALFQNRYFEKSPLSYENALENNSKQN